MFAVFVVFLVSMYFLGLRAYLWVNARFLRTCNSIPENREHLEQNPWMLGEEVLVFSANLEH